MKATIKWSLLLLIVLCVWLLWPEHSEHSDHKTIATAEDSGSESSHDHSRHGRLTRHLSQAEAASLIEPQGDYAYVYDKAQGANRFLIAKGRDGKYLPNSDAPSGMDLYYQDESGNNHLIDGSVTRAKFSPDGSKVAFTTSDAKLHIQDLQGGKLAEVAGVYGQSWKPDGKAVIYSKVGEGQDPHRPGTRHLSSLDIETGEIRNLTEGHYDDGRPEFGPSSDWVIFVSGARSGIASFWQVPASGGEPVQLTNVGLDQVNETFVPTPYNKTMWSPDQRWFVYDFKSGDQQEIWGIEFDLDGTVKRTAKLADGINPRWQSDGRTLVSEKSTDGEIELVISSLP